MKGKIPTNQCDFEVEAILDKEVQDTKTVYLVQWKDSTETTWEPFSNLQDCMDLVQSYEHSQHSQLQVAKKRVCDSMKKEENSRCRQKRVRSPSNLSPEPSKIANTLISLLQLETWFPDFLEDPNPARILTRSSVRNVVGSFKHYEVKSVLGHKKNAGGKVMFEVDWKVKDGISPEKSMVSFQEFRAHDPKKLSLYLVTLM